VSDSTGGAGGKGVVIIRWLTADAVAITTGSPTATTSGFYSILTFNDSGTVEFV
jgi:hypothetical protein